MAAIEAFFLNGWGRPTVDLHAAVTTTGLTGTPTGTNTSSPASAAGPHGPAAVVTTTGAPDANGITAAANIPSPTGQPKVPATTGAATGAGSNTAVTITHLTAAAATIGVHT